VFTRYVSPTKVEKHIVNNKQNPAGYTVAGSDAHLSHLDEHGQVRMVDVSHKQLTPRTAIAVGRIRLGANAFHLLSAEDNAKGEVLNTARVAGVLAAKRCADLSLCATVCRSTSSASTLKAILTLNALQFAPPAKLRIAQV